jgi:CRP/FNR family transcriptional regulator
MILARRDAREKVANLIYKIARRQSANDPAAVRFELPLSRADIADHLGLTVETVSRQFTKLKNDGIIVISNKTDIGVPDMARLARAAGL